MVTQLLAVEGSIGTGKSTVATNLAEVLRERGRDVRLVLEGDVTTPADFEQVAFLDDTTLAALLARYPDHATPVRASATAVRGGALIPYGVLRSEPGLPDDLLHELSGHDVYELPLDQHVELRLGGWRDFVAQVTAGDAVWVLDAALVQNPVTVSVLRDGAAPEVAERFVADLVAAAAALDPVVVRTRAPDIGEAFDAAYLDRPQWWRDLVVGYYTGRGLGAAMRVHGKDGTVAVLRSRAEIEERILAEVPVRVVDVPTRDGSAADLRDRIEAVVDSLDLPRPT